MTLEHAPRVAMLSVHTSPLEQPGTGDAGGMNVYVLELSRALAARGARVEIFTRATSSDQAETVLLPGTDAAGRPLDGDDARAVLLADDGRARRHAADPGPPRPRRPVRAAGQERPARRAVRHGRGRPALGGRAPARLVRRRALALLAVGAGGLDRRGPLGGAARAHRPHPRAREERVAGARRRRGADASGWSARSRWSPRPTRSWPAPRSRPRSWSSCTAPTRPACTSSSPAWTWTASCPGDRGRRAPRARAAGGPSDRAVRGPRAGPQGAGRAGQRPGRAQGDRSAGPAARRARRPVGAVQRGARAPGARRR